MPKKFTQIEAEKNILAKCEEKGYILLKPYRHVSVTENNIHLKCSIDGYEWVTNYHNFISNNRNCRKCSGSLKLDKYDFIWRSIQKHGYKYNYSKVVYVNNSTDVCIICPYCGEFWQNPSNHMKGVGCPKCKGYHRTNEKLIDLSNNVFNFKYDYSKTDLNKKDKKGRVCIVCHEINPINGKEHGEFWQTPSNHLAGRGCPKCGWETTSNKTKYWTKNRIVKEAKKYTRRGNFAKGSSGAYIQATKMGILEEVCEHMDVPYNISKVCIYSYTFTLNSNKYVYVGSTDNLPRRIKEHNREGAFNRKCKEMGITIPKPKQETEYMDSLLVSNPQKGIDLEGEYLQKYVNLGYISLNKAPTGSRGGVKIKTNKWCLENCKKKCLLFSHKKDVMKQAPMLYKTILENKWQNECFSHMTRPVSSQRRKIVALSLNDEYLCTFDSLKDAVQHVGGKASESALCNCARGKCKTAYNYKWMYESDYNKIKNM